MDLTETRLLNDIHKAETGSSRTDLLNVDLQWMAYMLGRERPDLATVTAPVRLRDLFWSVWRPEPYASGNICERDAGLAPLSEGTETALLARLGALDRHMRVQYQPDMTPATQSHEFDLIASAHVAAANAVATQRRDGCTEDVRDSLKYASWIGRSLRAERESTVGKSAMHISLKAVYGIVLYQLFSCEQRGGDLVQCFEFLRDSIECLGDALIASVSPDGSSEVDEDDLWLDELPHHLSELRLRAQDAADVIDGLLRRKDINWKQFAADLDFLAHGWDSGITGLQGWRGDVNDNVIDARGEEMPLFAFLFRSRAIAQDRLDADELRAYFEQREDQAAVNRLKVYFSNAMRGRNCLSVQPELLWKPIAPGIAVRAD
jgi:hypothetical protein